MYRELLNHLEASQSENPVELSIEISSIFLIIFDCLFNRWIEYHTFDNIVILVVIFKTTLITV